MNRNAIPTAGTAYYVTATEHDSFTTRTTLLAEWFSNPTEAGERVAALAGQTLLTGKSRYTDAKVETVHMKSA